MAYTFRGTKGSILSSSELDENFRYTEELATATTAVSLSAAVSAGIALASANFKGDYTGKTGALNMPASVQHLGQFWALKANVAASPGIQTKVPGTAPEWALIPLSGLSESTVHAATAKAAPADADELPLVDSVAGAWSLKKLTWAALKAALCTWLLAQANAWTGLQTFREVQETMVAASTGAAYTVNTASGTLFNLTLTANCTLTFPAATAGKQFALLLRQDATGSRAVVWPATVRWASGTAPVVTATAGRTDVLSFVADGSYWLGFVGAQNFSRV